MIPRRPFLSLLRQPLLARPQSTAPPSDPNVPPPPSSPPDVNTLHHLLQPGLSRNRNFAQFATLPPAEDDYHLHIYAHKHNTHITFTRPNKEPVISLSCGNIGFRKSHRGTYDAAYQLAAHVFRLIEEKRVKPRSLEVILRGFGQGREACTKALLGSEGRFLKPVIKRVTDSTRLKFGGTRSKAPRRLG